MHRQATETRCLWHSEWLCLSRPAPPVSPDHCAGQEKYGGRGSHYNLCLLHLGTAGKPITHLPNKHTLWEVLCGTVQRHTVCANPWVNAG